MDDYVAPWRALVKRVRFLASLKQADLAETLGVDQTSVSRWERNLCVPDFPVQKRLRDLLRKLEPAIGRNFIEQAPGIVSIGRVESVGFISAASIAGAAQCQLTQAEIRNRLIYDVPSESARRFLETIDSIPEWRQGELAMFRAALRRPDGVWAQYTCSPIGRTGLYMCMGTVAPPPKDFTDKDFGLSLNPYDELCD